MRQKRFTNYEYCQANKVISDIYEIYGSGLDMEECVSASWQAYFEVRHDIGGICNTDIFWELAISKIRDEIQKLRKIRNARINLESKLSLNQIFYDSDEPVYTYIAAKNGDFSNSICMWNYVQSLGRLKASISRMLYYGEDDREIMSKLRLPPEKYYELLRQLKDDFREYVSS